MKVVAAEAVSPAAMAMAEAVAQPLDDFHKGGLRLSDLCVSLGEICKDIQRDANLSSSQR